MKRRHIKKRNKNITGIVVRRDSSPYNGIETISEYRSTFLRPFHLRTSPVAGPDQKYVVGDKGHGQVGAGAIIPRPKEKVFHSWHIFLSFPSFVRDARLLWSKLYLISVEKRSYLNETELNSIVDNFKIASHSGDTMRGMNETQLNRIAITLKIASHSTHRVTRHDTKLNSLGNTLEIACHAIHPFAKEPNPPKGLFKS